MEMEKKKQKKVILETDWRKKQEPQNRVVSNWISQKKVIEEGGKPRERD
jgi:hypothetical protein